MKPISESYLKDAGFKKNKNKTFVLEIKNSAFNSIEIYVELISPAIGAFVSIKVKGSNNCGTIPIDYQEQLTQLINSLKGKVVQPKVPFKLDGFEVDFNEFGRGHQCRFNVRNLDDCDAIMESFDTIENCIEFINEQKEENGNEN